MRGSSSIPRANSWLCFPLSSWKDTTDADTVPTPIRCRTWAPIWRGFTYFVAFYVLYLTINACFEKPDVTIGLSHGAITPRKM